jgi:predicted MFS family arabinose efflux permease
LSRSESLDERQTNWFGVYLGLGLGAFAAYHQFKLPPALPMLLDIYGYDRVLAGGFMSIYALAGLLLSGIIGIRVQRQGVRRFVLIAMALFAAGSVITVLFPAWGSVVLAARGIEGVAFAMVAIAAPVITIGSAAPRHASMAMAIFAMWIPAGQLISLAAALPIIEAGAWRPLWWIGVAAAGVLALAVWRFAGSNGHEKQPQPNHSTPALDRRQRHALFLTAGVFTLWSTQMFAFLTWLPQYLVEDRGLDIAGAVLPYGVAPLFILIFNLVGGFLLRAGIPLGTILASGLGMQAIVWFLMPVLENPVAGLIALVVFGIGGGIVPTCLFAAPAAIMGQDAVHGRAFGVIMTGRNLGVFLGPILLPPLLSGLGDWTSIGLAFGAIGALAVLGAVALSVALVRVR